MLTRFTRFTPIFRWLPGRPAALAALSTLALSLPTLADDPQAGFVLEDLPYPGRSVTATLENGRIVSWDGSTVELWEEDGSHVHTIAVFSEPLFPSFLLVGAGGDELFFGESSFGEIFESGLLPGAPDPIATIALHFDAVLDGPDHLIVSASESLFFGPNQILRLNLASGATTPLAEVPGASGPVAFDASGNLYCGTVSTSFPAPPGSSRVLRWNASLLTGSAVLTEADATVVASGLDGAADLLSDPETGAMYLAENNFGTGINRIRKITGNPAVAPILVEGSADYSISNLEFESSDSAAVFSPYQPAHGQLVRYNTANFGSGSSARKAVLPLRPSAAVDGPGSGGGSGTFELSVSDGPPSGVGFVFYGPASQFDPNETAFQLRVPVFLGLNPQSAVRAPGMLVLDGSGAGTIQCSNPGGISGFAIQVFFLDASGRFAGSSTAAFL